MTARIEFEVVGIKDALREINQIDRTARREITKNFKRITAPVVSEAKSSVPRQPPLTGWGRSWKTGSGFQMLPWNGAKADTMIDTKVSGKRPKEFAGITRDLAVLTIRWRGMVNTIYDVANNSSTPQGANMIAGLNQKHGRASRVMWPAWDAKGDQIEKEIRQEIEAIMLAVNRKINQGAF